MPYRTADVFINWTGVDKRGLVQVSVNTQMPMSYAINAWEAFLRRFDDAGHAYTVTFDAPPDPPAASSPPSIAGTASEGQTLTESHGVWSNGPIAYTYQWEDCDLSGHVVFGDQRCDRTDLYADRHRRRSHDPGAGGSQQLGRRRPARDLGYDRRRNTASSCPSLRRPPSPPPDPGPVCDENTQPNPSPNPAGDSKLQRSSDGCVTSTQETGVLGFGLRAAIPS